MVIRTMEIMIMLGNHDEGNDFDDDDDKDVMADI